MSLVDLNPFLHGLFHSSSDTEGWVSMNNDLHLRIRLWLISLVSFIIAWSCSTFLKAYRLMLCSLWSVQEPHFAAVTPLLAIANWLLPLRSGTILLHSGFTAIKKNWNQYCLQNIKQYSVKHKVLHECSCVWYVTLTVSTPLSTQCISQWCLRVGYSQFRSRLCS